MSTTRNYISKLSLYTAAPPLFYPIEGIDGTVSAGHMRMIAQARSSTGRASPPRMIPALLLLFAVACGKHSLTVKPDAGDAQAPALPPDTAGIASEVPITIDLAGDGFPVTYDTSSNLDAPAPLDSPGDPPGTHPTYFDVAGPDLTQPDVAGQVSRCTQTSGTVAVAKCWLPKTDLFDTCTAPLSACADCVLCVLVNVCVCPGDSCFKPDYGCVGKAMACTVGMDQTCNDDPALSAVYGQCLDGGHCFCNGYELNPDTGKCR